MQYALLIYSEESALPENRDEAFSEKFFADFRDFSRALDEAGGPIAARRLQTVDTATTVRVVDGKRLTSDGPFAETKETLAGFFVIEAADLDEALDWAARLPSARIGSVEVRPIKTYG